MAFLSYNQSMPKKFAFLLLVVGLPLLIALSNNETDRIKKTEQTLANLYPVEISNVKIYVELATTAGQIEKGLSERNTLSEGQGMLFVFEKSDFHTFWMKGMLFPLDFIWIKGSKIVDLTENVQPEDFQPPNVLTPKSKVDKVLEVKAGFIKKQQINIGDFVTYTKIN